ncbi:nuclear transport factor 2 family protein [Actinotalea ferrariae]|uniref:nuclear transport factor 2 family protein n=1 Tax=Actinotalea ferrariae TaxID=1386098 RepID=UPI001C8BD275|nr:nuclear transport factor 2 family protein [Actinotalea ferrariae]MBX9243664.1 nuclear transport factor 2 family protein [Actinotalea ferrariae]
MTRTEPSTTPPDEGDEDARLAELERAGWVALSIGGDAAREHYERVLSEAPLMLLPGSLVLDDRASMVASMAGAPWDEHELEDVRVHRLADDAAVVAYGVRARRGDMSYSALMSSVYVRRDGWRLALHQQTPR